MTNWIRYGYCSTCEASEGNPCADLRYRRDGRNGLNADRPHRNRPMVAIRLNDGDVRCPHCRTWIQTA